MKTLSRPPLPHPPALTRGGLLLVLLLLALPVRAQTLPTIVVQPHAVDLTLPVAATVEALAQTTLTSQVSGRVVEMRVDVGQAVQKGELLLRIDAREASEAVAGARAQFVNAKANYERLKNLRQQNFISAAALDKAKADFEAAQAAQGQAGVSLGHASVTAPISGVVAQRLIEQGETAAPGRPLLTIYGPEGLRVTASIPQYQLPQMRDVKQARVEFPELGLWVDAKSVTLLPTADVATHVSQVRVGLPVGLKAVIPGMFARVHFVLGQVQRMTVPAAAVVRRGEVAAVYVQNAQGALSLRQLRLGETSAGGEIEVLAGLSSGERVVLDPLNAAISLKSAPAAGK
ncbi:efflux RND transporter periplasmic adaptor subunit [Propionivibrio sp.]|uniref:efflux RND transporter periplasmic adaptor subunit n=1 Tax=Propionivibrio sp. TaxID=2212460 RepID=UPI0025F4A082|nr:efflux RND transporter periplasmic adaptor subunit [Propionivibrio sp.]MBK7354588.1 efflux RND transporter periplasmic adaptor subunit [Propionivibrio sp.]MBK8743772.1 efflux RND transporter periplasmic adaptor subunit [Propionivibrio sp.]